MQTPTLMSAARIVYTVNGFRRQYGSWPRRILMHAGMAEGLPKHVLTPLGWAKLAVKLELLSIEQGTVIAEGSDGSQFDYADYEFTPNLAGISADEWIWGIKLMN